MVSESEVAPGTIQHTTQQGGGGITDNVHENKVVDEENSTTEPSTLPTTVDANNKPYVVVEPTKQEGFKDISTPEKVEPIKEGPVSKPSPAAATTTTTRNSQEPHESHKLRNIIFLMILVIIILVIVVPLVLMNDDDDSSDDPVPPVTTDFVAGVSLVTRYAVNATINSRLARSTIRIDVRNALECVSIHGVTVQLPKGARVAKMDLMDLDSDCKVEGKTMEIAQARESFQEDAAQGLPGAYVEERNSFTYSVQVSMVPFGMTSVELVVEQLLHQRVGKVDFQVPMIPLEKVDEVTFDLSIADVSQEANDIVLDMPLLERIPNTTSFHLEDRDARDHDLPWLVSGSYKPGHLPDAGVLYVDGNCFEHVFHPSVLEPMPKNVIFLIDLSDSMHRDNKLNEAKYALKNLTSSLTSEDTLTIQAFAGLSTEELKGMTYATPENKQEIIEWIDQKLTLRDGGTALFAALGEALIRAGAAKERNPKAVTVLVILSDGKPTKGETQVSRIAHVVRQNNENIGAKIFSLGFDTAALDLLKAISIMNDGATYTLSRGADYSDQMLDFFYSEFGTILMSDVRFALPEQGVNYTENSFPVLADGTELVVRGLIQDGSLTTADLGITVTGRTRNNGSASWTPTATGDPFATGMPPGNSRCHQSYAHDKITQLLDLAFASTIVGDEAVESLVALSKKCPEDKTLEACIREEALELAMEANLVVSGLTAMTTEDTEKCFAVEEEVEVCVDGTSAYGGAHWERPEASGGNEDVDGAPGREFDPADSYYNDPPTYYDASAGGVFTSYVAFLYVLTSTVLAWFLW